MKVIKLHVIILLISVALSTYRRPRVFFAGEDFVEGLYAGLISDHLDLLQECIPPKELNGPLKILSSRAKTVFEKKQWTTAVSVITQAYFAIQNIIERNQECLDKLKKKEHLEGKDTSFSVENLVKWTSGISLATNLYEYRDFVWDALMEASDLFTSDKKFQSGRKFGEVVRKLIYPDFLIK